eukprot:4695646-Pyramimonas_sp.AAC.1
MKDAIHWFRITKAARLHKSVVFFPAGIKIMAAATAAVSQRAKDEAHGATIISLFDSIRYLPDIPTECAAMEAVFEQHRPVCASLYTTLSAVSLDFQTRRETALFLARDKFEKAAEHVKTAINTYDHGVMSRFFQCLTSEFIRCTRASESGTLMKVDTSTVTSSLRKICANLLLPSEKVKGICAEGDCTGADADVASHLDSSHPISFVGPHPKFTVQ